MTELLLALALTLPNPTRTPGVIRPLSRTAVCSVRWGKDRRHVTRAMKRQVAINYGRTLAEVKAAGKGPCCEFDHKVPRELGGADTIANLWLQPWAEAHVKDRAENAAHRAVCAGTLTLQAAQRQFLNWGAR